jgi:AraC family transcriptional regulator, regulatory protein of adaptative response / methylated-DNA-[protein]-cysteine methyltransferase
MNELQRVRRVAAYIEQNLEGDVTLARLSREAGVSRFHLQRSFKAAVGVTPKQYAEACRLRSLKKNLREGGDVLGSVFGAGFGSPSRVYERVDSRLGMTPAEYRRAGASIAITHATVATSFGLLTIGATDRGVCFVQFGESAAELEQELLREYPAAKLSAVAKPWPEPLRAWIEALEQHLAIEHRRADGKKGVRPRLELPLDVRATAFQMRVWRYLQSIPYGETRSYAQVADGIGKPKGARAVAQACAKNRTALAIPCHRVIRGSGELGGYKWGVDRKQKLLDREALLKAEKLQA